jgi:photosystem II stability/assembly factor-like uncharacterized protein
MRKSLMANHYSTSQRGFKWAISIFYTLIRSLKLRDRIFLTALILLLPNSLVAQWKKLIDGGEFRAIYFLGQQEHPKTGFASSSFSIFGRPILYKTTDGGLSWKGLSTSDVGRTDSAFGSITILDFAFKDSLTGWFAEEDYSCYKTTNGGDSWKPLYTGLKSDPYWGWGVAYNPGNGGLFLSNSNYNQFTSWDEGTSWTKKNSIYGTGFTFADSSLGILSSKYANYPTMNWLRTTNGGYDWSVVPMDSSSWQPLAIKNSKIGFAITDFSAKVYRTDDAWDTWRQLYSFSLNEAPRDAQNYHVMSSGCIRGDLCHLFVQLLTGCYLSTDEGLSWMYLGGPPRSLWYVYERRFCVEGNRVYMGAIDTTNAPYGSPAQLWMLDMDSVNFAGTPCSLHSQISKARIGDTIVLTPTLDQSLTGSNAPQEISFLIRFDSSASRFQDIIPSPDWSLVDSSSTGETLRLVFKRVSTTSGSEIVKIVFNTLLSSSPSATFKLDSVRLNNSATKNGCSPLFTMARPDSVSISIDNCGAEILRRFMAGDSLLFRIDRVVPNPAQSVVRVEGTGLRVGMLDVYDVMGRQLVVGKVATNRGVELDTHDLPEGLYYIRIGEATSRFVIER